MSGRQAPPRIPAPASAPVVRLAATEEDRLGAQRLRYRVFVEELGGDGALVDHDARLERDAHDPHYDHLLLVDPARDPATLDHLVGVYRLMPGDRAAAAGGFYCAGEYDLAPLEQSGNRLLELGRSCIDPAHRGGTALYTLWQGLADYILERGIEVLFGVASFHGTDVAALAHPLGFLHHDHLAPPGLRVRALQTSFAAMDLLAPDEVDRRRAAREMPGLIKSYLRLGGFVGEGAWIDHAFNTTDICLVMETHRIGARYRALYAPGR